MSKKASFKKSFGLLVLAVGLVMASRWVLFEPYVIPSGSMIPTLLVNDHIIVSKYSFGLRWPFSSRWLTKPKLPNRGDVVVFRSVDNDNYYMIKRVIGLPGDKITYDEEGVLSVDGQPVESSWVSELPAWSAADIGDDISDYKVAEETIGEHKHFSLLAKDGFHYTEEEHVVPPDHIYLMGDNRDHSKDSRYWGDLPIQNLLGKATYVWLSCEKTLSQVNFICDPRYIRWQRFFHHIQ